MSSNIHQLIKYKAIKMEFSPTPRKKIIAFIIKNAMASSLSNAIHFGIKYQTWQKVQPF